MRELEERDRRDRRLRQRDHDMPEDSEVARALHSGGIGELGGDRREELTQQEDREGVTEERRDDERLQAADPPQLHEDHVERDAGDLCGQHHGGEDEDKDELAPPPLDTRQGIRDRHARDHDADRRQARVQQRVEGVADDREQGGDLGEVRPDEGAGPQVRGQGLTLRHQRGRDDEEERGQEEGGQDDRKCVVEGEVHQPPAPGGRGPRTGDGVGARGGRTYRRDLGYLRPPW
jgi:hypothetical protein